MKQHKVGTITLGAMLIFFGILFILRIFFPEVSYEIIFKLWPVIFIFLGTEIIISNFQKSQEKLVYDKVAIALIIILTFFAMAMAIAETSIDYANSHIIRYR